MFDAKREAENLCFYDESPGFQSGCVVLTDGDGSIALTCARGDVEWLQRAIEAKLRQAYEAGRDEYMNCET